MPFLESSARHILLLHPTANFGRFSLFTKCWGSTKGIAPKLAILAYFHSQSHSWPRVTKLPFSKWASSDFDPTKCSRWYRRETRGDRKKVKFVQYFDFTTLPECLTLFQCSWIRNIYYFEGSLRLTFTNISSLSKKPFGNWRWNWSGHYAFLRQHWRQTGVGGGTDIKSKFWSKQLLQNHVIFLSIFISELLLRYLRLG